MATFQLRGSVIAITGATGALGRALCAALADEGARLALVDLDQAALDAMVDELGGPDRAAAWVADVRDLNQLQAAMDAAAERFSALDMVIANAGVASLEPIHTQSDASFARVIDINLNGAWRTFKAALPHVIAGQGHLLAVASMASFYHSPLQGSYAASKAGLWALCDSIRMELQHQGVTVGSVHPTFFKTPLADNLTETSAGKLLYDNNTGLFKLTTIETVVSGTMKAIRNRSDLMIVPNRVKPLAAAPNLMRRLLSPRLFSNKKLAAVMAEIQRTEHTQ